MFKRRTSDENPSHTGVSVLLTNQTNPFSSKAVKKNKFLPSLSQQEEFDEVPDNSDAYGNTGKTRLKNLLIFLFYSVLFGSLVLALLIIDGPPRLPERWWSWQEIWTKLTGPADGLPLEFIKYFAATCGWMLLGYLALTIVIQVLVDTFYLISVKRHHGRPGKLVTGLVKATRRFTMPPLRRALDGLLLTTVLFSVATTALGGSEQGQHPGKGNQKNPGPDELDHLNELLNSTPAMTIQAQSVKHAVSAPTGQNPGVIKETRLNSPLKVSNIIGSKNGALQQTGLQPEDQPGNLSDTAASLNQAATTETVQYVVKPGDTLWKLAEYYYGDGHLYTRIYQANVDKAVGGGQHFTSAGIIYPGWVLTIPDVDSAKVNTTVGQNSTAQDHIYVVQPGDTLRKISAKLLGNENRWQEIWQLNAGHKMHDGKVAVNPDRIFPGWQFQLPPKPNGANATSNSNAGTSAGDPSPAQTAPGTSTSSQPSGNQQIQENTGTGSGQPANTGQDNKNQPGQKGSQPSPVQTPPVSTPIQGQGQGLSPVNPNPTPTPSAAQNQPAVTDTPSSASFSPTPKPTLQQTQPAMQQGSQNTSGGTFTPKPYPSPGTAKTPTPLPTPVVTQPSNPNAVEQYSEERGFLELPWQFIVAGLGSLVGFGFGLKFLASALRRRWNSGLIRRRREKVAAAWPTRQAPINRAVPEISLDANGNETGFATTERPLELIRYRQNEKVDTNKAGLVLNELQNFFHELGLPELTPICCSEGLDCLSYTLKGSPTDIFAYLNLVEKEEIWSGIEFLEGEGEESFNRIYREDNAERDSLEDDEDQDPDEDIISFADSSRLKVVSNNQMFEKELGAGESTSGARRNLQLILESRFASIVLIEQSGDALIVHLEQIQPAWKFKSLKNDSQEDLIKDSANQKGQSEPVEIDAIIDGNVTLTRTTYTQQAAELAQLYEEEEAEELPAEQISPGEAEPDSTHFVGYPSEASSAFNYTLLPVGATSPSRGRYALSAEHKHFHLVLESGQLLLVCGQEDEAARTVLYNSLFHLACMYSSQLLELNLVDLPVALEEDVVKALLEAAVSEAGAGRKNQLQESLKNRLLFQELIKLPHTAKAVVGDNSGGISWRGSLLNLLEELETEINQRSVEQALLQEKGISRAGESPLVKPKVIAIADLAAIMATEGHRMAAIIENGPSYGLFVVGAISYESLAGEIALPQPLSAANDISATKGETRPYAPTEMKLLLKSFSNTGLFTTVEESYSQLACGSEAALNLTGEGDMLLRMAPGQAIKLRGFALSEKQRGECLDLLLKPAAAPIIKEPDPDPAEPPQQPNQLGAENLTGKERPGHEYKIPEQNLSAAVQEEVQSATELSQLHQNPKDLERRELKPASLDKTDNQETNLPDKKIVIQPAQVNLSDFKGTEPSQTEQGRFQSGGEQEEIEEPGLNQLTAGTSPKSNSSLSLAASNPVIKPESSTSDAATTTPAPPEGLEVSEKLFQVRRDLFQSGLIGPVLDIHILHGIDLRLSLLPAKRNTLSLSFGSFFEATDALKVYELLIKHNLSLAMLEQELSLQNYPGTQERTSNQLDLEMAQLLDLISQGNTLDQLLQSGENVRTCQEVSCRLWNVCYGLESGCLTGHFNRNELELIGYLALLPKGQSRERILSDLFEEEKFISERRAFDTRLSRTRSTLSALLLHYLNMHFASEYDTGHSDREIEDKAKGTEEQERIFETQEIWDLFSDQKRRGGEKLDFFEEDDYGKIKLRPGLVRVDDWELMQLLTTAASEKLRNPQLYVEKLEGIHRWIAVTAKTHGEREGDANSALLTESLIKPLGTFGDRCNWDILERKRTAIMELWYNTNLYLGNFYQRKNPAKAFYHYGQAHALFPTFEDPVLSLMQISHNQGDFDTIRRVYRNYLKHCRREGMEPATLVEGCYRSFTGDDTKEEPGPRNPGNAQGKSKVRAVSGTKRRYAKS